MLVGIRRLVIVDASSINIKVVKTQTIIEIILYLVVITYLKKKKMEYKDPSCECYKEILDDFTNTGITEHISNKEYPINVDVYCDFFLNQIILCDEPCSHAKTKCITKQKRCSDEMETVIITCLSCGRVQNK